MTLNKSPAFYFALPRLLARLQGRRAGISENNATEAYLGGSLIFVTSYVFAAQLFVNRYHGWLAVPFYLLLCFAVWFFWLVALGFNSLVIQGLRRAGLFRRTPTRHAQNVLVCLLVAILAGQVALFHSAIRWVGIAVLTLIVLNAVAALLLSLSNSSRLRRRDQTDVPVNESFPEEHPG
jgi:hypothetical protein